MAVKVGNSWISAAAPAFDTKAVNPEEKQTNQELLKELSEKYRDIHFSMSQRPLNGNGANHIGISSDILQQMQKDSEKRAEYEALVYDCVQSLRNAAGGQSGGFLIHSDGSLSGWSVSRSGGQNVRSVVALNRGETNNWQSTLSAMQKKQEEVMRAGWERMCRMFAPKNTIMRVFYNPDGTVAGRMSITKPNKKKTKKLYYNFKQVSSMILRSKTSINARQAVRMARSKVALLRRKLGTGEYNNSELASAIIHAEKMVKIAKKKQKHLIDEELAEKKISSAQTDAEDPGLMEEDDTAYLEEEMGFGDAAMAASEEELQELMAEMQELMDESMESLEEANELDLLTEEMFANWDDMEPEDLDARKKKHRADELREVTEADMKYLRALFNRLDREKSSASFGVSLELGGNEIPVMPPEMPMPDTGGSVDVSV